MVVITSNYPKCAEFKCWKIVPLLEHRAKFPAKKLIRQRGFASKVKHYSQRNEFYEDQNSYLCKKPLSVVVCDAELG
jgi:hypothetical protein